MLPFCKTLLRTYFEQGLMHVVVDYLTFLILLNDFVRGVSRHALFYFTVLEISSMDLCILHKHNANRATSSAHFCSIMRLCRIVMSVDWWAHTYSGVR